MRATFSAGSSGGGREPPIATTASPGIHLIEGMVISRLNQVWVADITYIRIRTGFVYLAAILDAFSQQVIGYAVSTRLDTALTLEVLGMAIAERKAGPGSAVCFQRIRR